MNTSKKKRRRKIRRFEVDCIFRRLGSSREFTTTKMNFEAINMLMNLLDRNGIKDKRGKLIFEF